MPEARRAFNLDSHRVVSNHHWTIDDQAGKAAGFRPASTGRARVKQTIVTLDLEGVLTPEIWIAVAESTRIENLRLTTRDVSDYDALMRGRIQILDQHKLKLSDIQAVIGRLPLLDGALDFMRELRAQFQVIILSDTFEQFAQPLMRQLEWPTLFCNRLNVENDRIVGYTLRQPNQKKESVEALKRLNYRVIAAGDSFNDTAMLVEADAGIFFRAPAHIREQFPQFEGVETHAELLRLIREYASPASSRA